MRHQDVAAGFIHTPFNWIYADADARTAATGFASGDVNKIALQLSDATIWWLQAVAEDGTATWTSVGGGGTGTIPTLDKIPAPTSSVGLNQQKITNLADATNPKDAVNLETADGRYVAAAQLGAAGGVATLDGGGQVPLNQLGNAPSAGGEASGNTIVELGSSVSGTVTLDMSQGQVFLGTLDGNVTDVALTNVPGGQAAMPLLILVQPAGGGDSISLDSVDWMSPDGSGDGPRFDTTGGAASIIQLLSYDGGTTLIGHAPLTTAITDARYAPIAAVSTVPSTQQSAAYTFALSDAGTVVESTASDAVTFTIPTNASVSFPVGAVIEVFQESAGQVTIAGASGVTLRSDGGKVKTAGQYATIGLRQRATEEWVLSGDLGT